MNRDAFETRLFAVLRWVVIVVLALVTLFPFYYMVLLSVRPVENLLADPGRLWVGLSEWTGRTYQEVLGSPEAGGQGMLDLLTNSALVSLGTVVLTLLISIPGAYAVSRLRFAGRTQIHFLFLAVYMFPAIVLAVPLFVLFTKLGLRDSLPGLMIVYIAQTLPVSIYMLRTYLSSVPVSIEEAALIDGCSRWQVMWRVTMPLAVPAIMANALYVFMVAWNEFLFALLFLAEDRSNWTVSLGLAQLAGGIEVPKTVLMAGSVVLTVPIVILFYAAERMLTEGLTSGADKG
ncbi:carbohydrate ABC transporter permease [Kibdelosporangium persicum]|uniref:Binding-protein-dependent transport systems inner membrane component n=1 Tax=Kibdelosporangium persicum TaxID=2698649 RepID=A0ABX2FJ17_9PSEU|nr:carbohydrate ABC transporter permease [Kibdelosporangium persicum]NRN71382.1 Binding-protein-dependent transport systems inner membrane component [Kibdelosporangium persicum]